MDVYMCAEHSGSMTAEGGGLGANERAASGTG